MTCQHVMRTIRNELDEDEVERRRAARVAVRGRAPGRAGRIQHEVERRVGVRAEVERARRRREAAAAEAVVAADAIVVPLVVAVVVGGELARGEQLHTNEVDAVRLEVEERREGRLPPSRMTVSYV